LMSGFDAEISQSVDESILNNIESYGIVQEYFVRTR